MLSRIAFVTARTVAPRALSGAAKLISRPAIAPVGSVVLSKRNFAEITRRTFPKIMAPKIPRKRTLLNSDLAFDGHMTENILKLILEEKFPDSMIERDGPGRYRLDIEGGKLRLYCFIDEVMDRVNFMIPIQRADNPDEKFLTTLLEANFYATMDVRYSLSEGVVWSMYSHPLLCLTPELARYALDQVVTLANTTGTYHCSTSWKFSVTTVPPRTTDPVDDL